MNMKIYVKYICIYYIYAENNIYKKIIYKKI